jgi:hypothetical protein
MNRQQALSLLPIIEAYAAGESYDYKEMLDIYLFADGTPFGTKI